MKPLRHFPSLRLRWKLFLCWHGMMLGAIMADDERDLARNRQAYGRRTLWLVRYHRRLRALTTRATP